MKISRFFFLGKIALRGILISRFEQYGFRGILISRPKE